MIKMPNEIVNENKKIRMIIAGPPGIGKTTLALSAPAPILIDTDRGLDRVNALHRAPFIQPESFGSLMADMVPENLSRFETVVVDTGGQLLSLIADHVIKENPKNGRRDGALSLQGYGAAARAFAKFIDQCYYTLNKNVVIVFHAKEVKEGDATKLRLLVDGKTREDVWQVMDIGGFVEIESGSRVIGFSNCEKYYAKGTHGITGKFKIPELKGPKNTFLSELFERMNENMIEETRQAEEAQKAYEAVMNRIAPMIEKVKNAKDAGRVLEEIKGAEHGATSETELKSMLWNKAKESGLTFDKLTGAFV